MKRLLSITALALAIALSLAFTGCSGAQKDASANFQGSWKMTNVAGATEDDIAVMEAFGMSVVLDLNEDKTAVLDVVGEEISGTWEAKSSTETHADHRRQFRNGQTEWRRAYDCC